MTRFGYVLVTHFSVVTISILNWISVSPKLIWNASASVPIGLYAVQSFEYRNPQLFLHSADSPAER